MVARFESFVLGPGVAAQADGELVNGDDRSGACTDRPGRVPVQSAKIFRNSAFNCSRSAAESLSTAASSASAAAFRARP